jgi:hypothetical protein
MAHAHALVDAIEPEQPDDSDDDDVPGVEVLVAGERQWLTFGADFDEPDYEDIGAHQGQLNELMNDLEQADLGEPYVSFNDEDNERAVFRVSALAAVAIDQELRWGGDDGYAEEPEDEPPAPSPEPKRKQRSPLKVVRKR